MSFALPKFRKFIKFLHRLPQRIVSPRASGYLLFLGAFQCYVPRQLYKDERRSFTESGLHANMEFSRMAILYLRIFPDHGGKAYRRACYALLFLTLAYWLFSTLSIILLCQPITYTWTYWDGLHKGSVS